ncbi:uncharacterized protein F5147DRAFT_197542 [Suillus discolor]|uniref:HBS1-like protein N-terminal domain-containing protein n=1 Tax=Suillus discolor TaxID=1912936 RepID=A0A9P7FJZ6_9AGAM|nr:uncharacterized protein F5147DRAFT_197542 [Suillus discolor]KAG2119096.1 hypothetical protein F5147DRAFT_197542 [Suillus discolor]
MSRHRLVRNMNIHDELDDAALSDGGDELTPEQHAQMTFCLEQIRELIGDEAVSGLDDDFIKETLWDQYFNVESSLSYLYDEQDRRASAKTRKVVTPRFGSRLWNRLRRRRDEEQEVRPDSIDILPSEGEEVHDEPQYVAGPTGYEYYDGDLDRPRVPLIVLAQQGQHEVYYPEEFPEEVDSDDIPLGVLSRGSRLSTITEITERTEPSRHWPSKQQLVALNNPRASMITDTTTSYGEVIDTRQRSTVALEYPETAMDPNFIPPSPSPSAVQRLSSYEAAPSLATSVSQSDIRTEPLPLPTERATSRAKSSVVPVPPLDTLPEISDFQSKASGKPLPPKPPTSSKPSKLSMLASSRASTRSSRSSDLETTSILTYPALRPTAESRLSFATTIKPPPAEKILPSIKAPSTTPSSMSGHVKQAIQTALELEAHDRERIARPSPKSESSTASKASSVATVKPTMPHSPPRADATPNLPIMRQEVEAKARPQSKLAALAQAKASANTSLMPKLPKSPPSSPPKELPKPHTQFFTPIANGATATTAITTSYQSLQSLSRPQAQEPASLVQMPGAEPKQSKLAKRIKKASEKPQPTPPDDDTDSCDIIQSPLFIPKPTNSHKATHSAHKYGREVPNLVKVYEASHSQSHSSLGLSQSQRHKSSRPRAALPGMKMNSGFAFDVPSPDDIVFNARRGTSFSHRR